MQNLKEKSEKSKLQVFPREKVKTSKNAKVKEVVTRLEDKAFLDRITAYSEVHDRWEKSGWW